MMILQLLAEGAIDTDEAVQLLKALGHKGNIEKSVECEKTWENICIFLEMVEEEVISANKATKLIKSMKTGKEMEEEEQELMEHILGMIEEGEIDAYEGAELLKSLEFFNDLQWDPDLNNIDENVQQFARNSEGFAEDFSERFHAAFKNVEPELDAAAKEVLGAVATLLDDVSQSLKGKNNEPYDKDTQGGDSGE